MKKIFVLVLSIYSCMSFSQQESHQKRGQIRELKHELILNELQLDNAIKNQFWAVYDQFDEKQMNLKRNKNQILKRFAALEASGKLTESESQRMQLAIEKVDKDLYLLKQAMYDDLKKILPYSKIVGLIKLENDFNRLLLKKIRQK
jgi:Spy/CpxP family protein refolding chaperone